MGVLGNPRSLDSVATLRCFGDFYPSTEANRPGFKPDYDTITATCQLDADGRTAIWKNGTFKCIEGN